MVCNLYLDKDVSLKKELKLMAFGEYTKNSLNLLILFKILLVFFFFLPKVCITYIILKIISTQFSSTYTFI